MPPLAKTRSAVDANEMGGSAGNTRNGLWSATTGQGEIASNSSHCAIKASITSESRGAQFSHVRSILA